jgi:hypothetical protein
MARAPAVPGEKRPENVTELRFCQLTGTVNWAKLARAFRV